MPPEKRSVFLGADQRAKRHDRNLSCAIIEIDNINEIKDKYGDQFCDSVVQDRSVPHS